MIDPGPVLHLILRNLARHRLRNLLTGLGIAVAILAFGLLRTLVDSWYAGAEIGSAGRLICRNDISLTFPLPVSYAASLRHIEGVRAVSWANWFGGIYIDEHHFFPQFAVDAATYFQLYPEYHVPAEQLRTFQHDRQAVIVGRKTARDYGWKIGDQVPLRGTIYPGNWSFRIAGIYQGKDGQVDESQFILHWDYVNETIKQVLPDFADKVGIFVIAIDHPDQAGAVAARIDAHFRNSLAATRTETQKAFQLSFVAMVDTILIALQTVAYVVILIIMAVLANTIVMSARERVREYSALRALGFSPNFISLLILGESMLLAGLGAVLGILFTFPAASLFHHATGHLFAIFRVTPWTLCLQLLAAVLVGLAAALLPILSMRRVSISEGLRAMT